MRLIYISQPPAILSLSSLALCSVSSTKANFENSTLHTCIRAHNYDVYYYYQELQMLLVLYNMEKARTYLWTAPILAQASMDATVNGHTGM